MLTRQHGCRVDFQCEALATGTSQGVLSGKSIFESGMQIATHLVGHPLRSAIPYRLQNFANVVSSNIASFHGCQRWVLLLQLNPQYTLKLGNL